MKLLLFWLKMFLGKMFIFLIAIAILGVLFRSIIEFPNEIFFGSEVTHEANSYSYGTTRGTTFEFFRVKGEAIVKIPTIVAIIIPTLFYTGILSVIFLFLTLKTNEEKWNRIQRIKEDNKKEHKRKERFSRKEHLLTYTIIVLIIGFTFCLGNYYYS